MNARTAEIFFCIPRQTLRKLSISGKITDLANFMDKVAESAERIEELSVHADGILACNTFSKFWGTAKCLRASRVRTESCPLRPSYNRFLKDLSFCSTMKTLEICYRGSCRFKEPCAESVAVQARCSQAKARGINVFVAAVYRPFVELDVMAGRY